MRKRFITAKIRGSLRLSVKNDHDEKIWSNVRILLYGIEDVKSLEDEKERRMARIAKKEAEV